MTQIAPNPQKIQVEATQFRAPVGESVMSEMGGSINYALDHIFQVGDICPSMQTESNFQALHGTNWILADGRAVPGSIYEAMIGSNVPDMRGAFIRGKNNGKTGTGANPDGDVSLGTFQDQAVISHQHEIPNTSGSGTDQPIALLFAGSNLTQRSGAYGGNETRPANITVNYFIRIN